MGANVYTIFEYLDWRGDLSFEKSPFNDIDAAILARFSYAPLDGIVPKAYRRTVTLEKACLQMLNLPDLTKKTMFPDDDVKFIQKMFSSERFKHIRLSGFVNETDLELQTQFSAVIYSLGEANYYVAFRGTDSTVIAWKEDFNMGFEFPVPAQRRALEYFEEATSRLKEGTFIIGGHSKGGNLSIYSAAFCDSRCQDQILAVYNFDGPGFMEDLMERLEFKNIEAKIKTFVPQFSIVGMILEHMEEYSVVKSTRQGIAQHELFSWELGKDSFVTLDTVDKGSKLFDNTLKTWLSKLSKEEREVFVDTLYQILTGGESTTFGDISDNKFESVRTVIKNYSNVSDDVKKAINEAMKLLIKSAGRGYKLKGR